MRRPRRGQLSLSWQPDLKAACQGYGKSLTIGSPLVTGTPSPGIVTAIVGASASISAAAIAVVAKLWGEARDGRRVQRATVMAIRNEIRVNLRLAKLMQHGTRMVGLRFSDDTWRKADTSAVYQRGVPADDILDLYAEIQAFNALAERIAIIEARAEYSGKAEQVAKERVEASAIVDQIAERAPLVLDRLRRWAGTSAAY